MLTGVCIQSVNIVACCQASSAHRKLLYICMLFTILIKTQQRVKRAESADRIIFSVMETGGNICDEAQLHICNLNCIGSLQCSDLTHNVKTQF